MKNPPLKVQPYLQAAELVANAPALIDLGYRPHTFQRKIHESLKRFNVLVCHRRFGKTLAMVMALIDAALRANLPDSRFGYIAPLYSQAKSVAWPYLKRYGLRVPGARVNESELSLILPNGSTVRLFGANNPDSLRGMYFDGVVLDEVAQMSPDTWGEIIRPALADRRGWAVFIGTPKGLNLFSELYYEHLDDPDWYVASFDAEQTVDDYSTPLDRKELDILRKSMSDSQFRQEMMCDFGASTDDTLISIDLVMMASKKQMHADAYHFAPRVIGVDVARFGRDRSVIQKRQGLLAYEPIVYRGLDNMILADRVAREMAEFKADAVFIDSGRGEGVIDRLRHTGHTVMEVDFAGAPANPKYLNKRAEMWHEMKAWMEAGGCITPNQELIQCLVMPTYKFNIAGKIQLESKEDIKDRVGFSPDLGDALALTFAHPVRANIDSVGINVVRDKGRAKMEYDPLNAWKQ